MAGQPKPEIVLELKLGALGQKAKAAPAELAGSLRKASVSQNFEGHSGFSLEFEAERYDASSGDDPSEYTVLAESLLDPFCRVELVVQIDGEKTVLMDGFITQQDMSANADGSTTISVRGEDVSIKMDLFEVGAEYAKGTAGKKSSEIATEILGKYQSLVDPEVKAPSDEAVPNKPRQQRATDRKYLAERAGEENCIFYISPPESPGGLSKAYWGPPKSPGPVSQKALTINLGPADNLSQVSASYNGLAASVTYGEYLKILKDQGQADEKEKEKVADLAAGTPQVDNLSYAKNAPISSDMQALAKDYKNFTNSLDKLSVKGKFLAIEDDVGANIDRAERQAQASTDSSVREVVTVQGSVDTVRYKAVLQIREAVELRGVGSRYDGTYLVKSVNHSLSFEPNKWTYNQSFSLVRPGTGATISQVTKT